MSPRSTTLWGILATTLTSFALVADALPQPQAQETVAPSPKVWVSVDDATKGATITPTVTTDASGTKHTNNPPPDHLTESKAYTSFNQDGAVATYTSLNPAPTASAISGFDDPRGEFLACLPQQSRDEPFCAPKRDAILKFGRGYYITWNTLYFGSPNQRIQISIQPAALPSALSSSSSLTVNLSALPRFPIVQADQGFAFFPLSKLFLPVSDDSKDDGYQLARLNITMDVWASGNYDEDAPSEIKQGPVVYVTGKYDSDDEDSDDDEDDDLVTSPGGLSTGKKIAISVPVAVVSVLVLGGLIAFAVCGNKKNGHASFIGGLFGKRRGGGGGGSGYGVRKSYSERIGKRGVTGVEEGVATSRGAGDFKGGGGVELTDCESWSPTSPASAKPGGGENVFRAEVERQERARQGL